MKVGVNEGSALLRQYNKKHGIENTLSEQSSYRFLAANTVNAQYLRHFNSIKNTTYLITWH